MDDDFHDEYALNNRIINQFQEKLKNNEEIGVIDFSAPSTNTTATVVEEMSENTMQLPKIPPTEDISTPTDNIQSQASREEEITLTPADK